MPEGRRTLSSITFHVPSLWRTRSQPATCVYTPPGRPDAMHGAREVRARDDQPPVHEAHAHDLARVVDVVDKVVQRADALGQAALDVAPFLPAEAHLSQPADPARSC